MFDNVLVYCSYLFLIGFIVIIYSDFNCFDRLFVQHFVTLLRKVPSGGVLKCYSNQISTDRTSRPVKLDFKMSFVECNNPCQIKRVRSKESMLLLAKSYDGQGTTIHE